jgi:hypothetical protein
MRSRILLVAATAVPILLAGSASQASLVNLPVPSNAYIQIGNLDWAWASPLAGNVDLSYEGQFGWRLPTATELVNAPLATQFIFRGANVPFGGSDPLTGANFQFTTGSNLNGDAALAAPYFNNCCNWGDYGNAPGSNGANVVPWAGQPGAFGFSESLVVRDVASPAPGPTPGAGLMSLALLALAGIAANYRGSMGAR